MLNPVFSFCVYLVEMIISYIFYGSVFEPRFTPVKRLLIGSLLFSLGSGVNILFTPCSAVSALTLLYLKVLFTRPLWGLLMLPWKCLLSS